MILTRAKLNSITLAEIEAMDPVARVKFFDDLCAFWAENARAREFEADRKAKLEEDWTR